MSHLSSLLSTSSKSFLETSLSSFLRFFFSFLITHLTRSEPLTRLRFQRLADNGVNVVAIIVIRVSLGFFDQRIAKIPIIVRRTQRSGGEQDGHGKESAEGGLERFEHRGRVLESDGLSTRRCTLPTVFLAAAKLFHRAGSAAADSRRARCFSYSSRRTWSCGSAASAA